MRWILVVVVPLVAVVIAALVMTQQRVLWNVTEAGMSTEEVRAVLPQAVVPPASRTLANGLELRLVAPQVSNLERAFDAEFYFGTDGLQTVRLLPTRRLAPQAALAEFEELRQVAGRRYGKELGPAPTQPGVVAQARWAAGPVIVTLGVEEDGPLAAVTMTYAAQRRGG
jgi:hypothetical protein